MKADDIPINTYSAAATLLNIDNLDGKKLKEILKQIENPVVLSVTEVAEILRVNRRYVSHLIKQDVFCAARVGKRHLVSESSLREWLSNGGGTVSSYTRCTENNS